jgi:hypothetical protein
MKPNTPFKEKILLTVCGISRQKGLIYLVKSLEKCPQGTQGFKMDSHRTFT